MDIWIEMLKDNNLFRAAEPASAVSIEKAELKLGITFADEYKRFLSGVGACICFGHEIKGLTDDVNLNVVSATEEARRIMEMVPHSWYVIEDLHMDNFLILQDKNGFIYQMAPDEMPVRITYSLENYLSDAVSGMNRGTKGNTSTHEGTERYQKIDEKASAVLNSNMETARKKLENPEQVEKILQQVEKKLSKIPGIGDWLADVPAIISLIRSYIRKEYENVPASSIAAGLAAILYLVSPVDIIPDLVPGIGLLDDAAVFVTCWKLIHDDVEKYKEWRKQQGREIQ